MARESNGNKIGKNGSRLSSFNGRSGVPATFAACEAGLLLAVVHWMSESGAAIRFGKTSDLGALAIGLYDGDDKRTEYLRPSDDLNEWLFHLLRLYAPNDVVEQWGNWLGDGARRR